jgi:hypothetical protein
MIQEALDQMWLSKGDDCVRMGLRDTWSLVVCSTGIALATIRLGAQLPAGHAAVEHEIATDRSAYYRVEAMIGAGELRRRDTVVTCIGSEFADSVTTYRDSANVVRGLIWRGGTDDQAVEMRYYYDPAGRLRFALARRGAVNGTEQEERVYYAESGAVVRRRVHTTHGPGYPFSELPALQRSADLVRELCR